MPASTTARSRSVLDDTVSTRVKRTAAPVRVIHGGRATAEEEPIGVLRSSAVLACAVAALAAAAPAGAADDPYAALLAPSGTCGPAADALGLDAATAQSVMLCLTNYARAQSGLPPLRSSATLDAAGQAKLAADLSCSEFSHTPCGQPFEAVFADYVQGATSYQIGENIAWGTGSFGTPRNTMDGWLHSEGHRENILTAAYAELGIGYLAGRPFQGYSGATLWSQEFGVRSPSGGESSASATKAQPKPKVRRHRRTHRRA
jgi:uncharacterized protein YkwD